MSKPWLWIIGLTLAVLPLQARADGDAERRTLTGLAGVHVEVAPADEPLVRAGLDAGTLRGDVEAALRSAGLQLLTAEQSARTPGVPWLYLMVGSVKSQNERLFAWRMELMLRQRVCLERDPKSCGTSTTWSTSRFGSVGTRRLGTIREDVGQLAQEFVVAWQAANSKR